MIEQAVDFVLSKINLYVGDRSKNIYVDVAYEIPKQVVTEAIVNAVCHRDYTSNGSVQVMLFANRFEVSNPGSFPHELTVEQLYVTHRSIPANPLIAEAMYLRGTIERMGTGTEEMTKQCLENGLGKPEFIPEYGFQTVIKRINAQFEDYNQNNIHKDTIVNAQVNTQVNNLLFYLDLDEKTTLEITTLLKLKDRISVMRNYIQPALKLELIEMTIPDKPNSRLQKYRLTAKGLELKNTLRIHKQ